MSRLRFSLLAGCGLLLLALAALVAWRATPAATWIPGGMGSGPADRSSGSVALVTTSDGLSGTVIDTSGVTSLDGSTTGTGTNRSSGTLYLGGTTAGSGTTTSGGGQTGSSTQFGTTLSISTTTQFGTGGVQTGTGTQTGTSTGTQTGSGVQTGSGSGTGGQGGNGQGGNGQGGGIPPGEGTTTPELPAGILVGIGLVPLLLGVAWFRRRRSGLDVN